MKQSKLLTIEKLKYVMDKEPNVRRHDVTGSITTTPPSVTSESNVVKKMMTQNQPFQQQHTASESKPRINISHSVLKFVGTALGPILPSDNRNSDGRIASIVYLICLTTAGIVMNITAWLQKDDNVGITTDHIDGFLITCIVPSLFWIVYMFCKQNERTTVDFIRYFPHCHRPLLAGAYVFGAGSSVSDILHISFHAHCSHNIASLVFSVFKGVFILTQVLFLRKFASSTLHQSQYIRLVLFHILGTNICIWFRALFTHARILLKGSSVHLSWCGVDAVPLSKISIAAEPYLYPFTMEYSLIAGGILYALWSELRDLHPDPQDIYIYDEMQESGDGHGKLVKVPPFHQTYVSRSFSQLSISSRGSRESVCRTCHDADESHEIMDEYRPSSDPGFLLALLLSMLLYISIACLWMDGNSQHALRFYYVFQITLHGMILVCLWTILMALQHQKPVHYAYNSDDALLIISFTGVLLYSGLSLTANISELHTFGVVTVYSLIRCALVLVEAMLQVTAIVKSLRFRPPAKRLHSDVVRQCALFLLTTNLALWGRDSFFELHDLAAVPVQARLFGETTWGVLTTFAHPLCVFFRFHSAACLYEVWSAFKK